MTDLISSASNPIAKRVRSLSDRRTRKQERSFVVEGMQPVWRAVESGWRIDTLIVAPQLATNPVVDEMVDQVLAGGARVAEISSDLFNRLSDRDGPSGVMAIVEMQTTALEDLTVGTNDAWLILHRVHNPGNLGTILRTADAAGMAGVILTADSTDPFAPAAVKASMGAIFSLPLVIEPEFSNVQHWATAQNVTLVGTSGYATTNHWDFTWPRPVGLVLGNEGDGLPGELVESLDHTVRIPMTGTAESLNLSIAAGLLMYEIQRHFIV